MVISVTAFSLWLYNSPSNPEELFNLQHASAQNVIERIFGVIKQCFKILVIPPEYTLDVQARVFPACAALHNVILKYDPAELADMLPSDDNEDTIETGHSTGQLATEFPQRAEKEHANRRCDVITQDMWDGYLNVLRAQGL